MSADNWTTCPRCESRRLAELDRRGRELLESYGKIAADDYVERLEELRRDRDARLGETFREDYEIYGADEGVVHVSYSGHCAACDLKLSFEEDHPLAWDEEAS